LKILYITWKDHYSESGWQETKNLVCTGHMNVSIGFCLLETDTHYSLAQSTSQDESLYSDVIHIMKNSVVNCKELYADIAS